MRQLAAVLAAVIGVLTFGGVAWAQGAPVPGGLMALPTISEGANKLQNPGFETLSGGFPAGWSTPSGWGADQATSHGGTFSYRRGSGAPSATQKVALKKGVYNLSAWIKTDSVGGGNTGIRLQIDLRPTVSNWVTTPVITGTRDWTLYEVKNVVVPQDLTATVVLENYAGAAGTAWFDDVKLVEQLPQGVDVYLLYPNYRGMLFDDQPQTMRFDVTVTPPVDDFARYTVRGTIKDEGSGQVIISRDFAASANFVAEIDGSLMSYGRPYLATFSLVDRSTGSAVHTYPAYRVSRAAAALRQSMNVAFDAQNRLVLRGKPRFILGVYDSGGGFNAQDSFWENQIWSPTGARGLEGLRINMYLNYWMGSAPADAMKALMANLQKRGVMYLQTGNCFSGLPAGNDFLINSSDAYVRDIGAHAGSAGYYTADECNSAMMPGVFAQYQRIRQLDPDSMTFAALFGNPDIRLWRDAADVLSADPYPMYGAEPAGGYNHRMVADWTIATREAVKNARPFLTVLQFFKFTSQGRWPNLQDMRNHAYMAIVEGAKGLWWWSAGNGAGALATVCSGWCAERTGYLANLKAMVGELADLEPVLLADDAPSALRGNSNAAIRTKVKVVGGKGYVFAYNYTNQATAATFTWNTAPGAVTVNAEGRTLAGGANNTFSDNFGPFQAHVYVIGNGGSGGTTPPGGGTPPPGGGTTAPTVAFTNPKTGATLTGTATLSTTASGGTAPYSYQYAVDGKAVYTGANNTFSLNTTTVPNGQRTLSVTATDSATPARSATASVSVSVANGTTPPPPPASGGLQVSFSTPAAGATVSGTVWPHVWVSGQSGTSNTFTLTVDGKQVATATSAQSHTTLGWDTKGTANGTRTLTATVRDAAGKTGTASLTLTVTNAGSTTSAPPPPPPPTTTGGLKVTFSTPAAGATVKGTVWPHIWVTGQSGSSNTFTLAVDGRVVATKTLADAHTVLSWPSTGSNNGNHTLTATVRDATGKTGSAQLTIKVAN